MEPIRPKKGSRGSSRRSGSGSSRSERSSSRASQKSNKGKKEKENVATEVEKEVDLDYESDELQNAGFAVEETDSDDSEVEQEKDEVIADSAAVEGEDVEPYVDEEAVKAELGGDPEDKDSGGVKRTSPDDPETNESKEEEEKENIKASKKRGRKLKKITEKKIGFDGREVIFVTDFTQTDWKWKDSTEKSGKGTLVLPTAELGPGTRRNSSGLKSILVKPESRQTISQARTEEESTADDRTGTDLTPFSLQPNDEFGIPMLDMSSDSDSSDAESPKKTKTQRHHLPTIGPPQILKYIRESDRMDKDMDKMGSDAEEDFRMDSTDLVLDEQGNAVGMFSGPCEFCGDDIKSFPTLDQQLSQPPESLYCCEDYREFVEFAMTTATRLEEDVAKKNEKIDIKVHGHHGSKQARKMAKEQAVQRMRERELQRRQQEATGMQQAFFQSGTSSQAGMAPRGPKPNQAGGAMMFKDMDSRSDDVIDTGRPGLDSTDGNLRKPGKKGAETVAGKKEGDFEKGGGRALGGVREKGGISVRGGGNGIDRGSEGLGVEGHLSNQHISGGVGQTAASSFSSYGNFTTEVARQMKTINYQLSSQRCLEEGWTLRAPSPLDMDDIDNEIFVPEPLHPAMIASGKLHGRKLIEKFYPDGSKFLTMFPDGTGNVFYPSGRVAILIISVALGQYTYVVQDDCAEPELLAVFEPNGYGCCYFANGKVRLNYDQIGGLELDFSGGRKKIWNWKDQETHVHAPPFQPIVFGMNRYIGVRFMAQESIALTLTGRKRSCRFNVGAKLKLVSPENIQSKGIDEYQLYIDERKVRVEHILNKVTNLLKFPKSPKVDRILPPLSVTSKQQKVDKMRREYTASSALATQTPGRKPRKIKQTRLSPLDVPSVSVN